MAFNRINIGQPPVQAELINNDKKLTGPWTNWFGRLVKWLSDKGVYSPEYSGITASSGSVSVYMTYNKTGNLVYIYLSISPSILPNTISTFVGRVKLPFPPSSLGGDGAILNVAGSTDQASITSTSGGLIVLPTVTNVQGLTITGVYTTDI